MDCIERIKTKIENIEKLLTEVKAEIGALSKEKKFQAKKVLKDESLPSNEALRAEYEKVYKEFAVGNASAIEEFIKSKTKNYLKFFCKANSLPVDTTKVSKDGIVKEVMQWMAQRKAITEKVGFKR